MLLLTAQRTVPCYHLPPNTRTVLPLTTNTQYYVTTYHSTHSTMSPLIIHHTVICYHLPLNTQHHVTTYHPTHSNMLPLTAQHTIPCHHLPSTTQYYVTTYHSTHNTMSPLTIHHTVLCYHLPLNTQYHFTTYQYDHPQYITDFSLHVQTSDPIILRYIGAHLPDNTVSCPENHNVRHCR
jgi:hypothetical protein